MQQLFACLSMILMLELYKTCAILNLYDIGVYMLNADATCCITAAIYDAM